MYQIQTLNKISKYGLEKFAPAQYTYGDGVENPDAVLVRSASMHDVDFGENLLAIARAGAGVNNIPLERCSEQGIVVFNTPGANANAVKELVVCGLLLSSRKIPEALDWCKTLKGEGDQVGKLVEKGKSSFAGPEIAGKTLGVIGLGAIGILVANAATDLGMHVVGYDPFLSVGGALCIETSVEVTSSMDAVFAAADYISLHLPLNDKTRGMINAQSLEKAKDGVRILNFARGELVNSDDIIAALDSGKASAYVTDFPTDAQIGAKGVIAIPHLGASTPESEDNCAVMAASEVIDYLEKGIIKNSVNMPEADLVRSFHQRVCIIHQDVEGIHTKITALLEGCSVEGLTSAVKSGMGYTVADVAAVPDLEELMAVEGVIRVRILS